jgi:hypothetical protein
VSFLPPFPEIPPVYRRVLFVYAFGLLFGVMLGSGLTREWMQAPVLHAQSSTWEVIAHPEPVGGAMLAIVRHVATKQCYLIAQSEGVAIQPVSGTLCGDPPSKWETLVIGETSEGVKDEPSGYWRMSDDKPSQPSAGQTTKQPGAPK